MTFPLPPNATIGLVGGGQLGRMSAMAAARLGYRCHILTREPDSPAGQVADGVTLSDYSNPGSLREFARAVDVISFEFENVSAEGLELLASMKPVRPSPDVLRISQDRVKEKSFLNAAGVATAPWAAVSGMEELRDAAARIGFPAILKTTRYGYDGKGQARLDGPDDLAPAFARLEPKPLILEGFVDFALEVSVIVARGADGSMVAFDTVENRHRHHILDLTFAPARIPETVAHQAQQVARRIAERLDLIGLLAVEMFVDPQGRVLANEIAPRPHNSGHWTLDACPASQFEMHIRAIAGLPLPTATRHSDAVMRNLVGPEDMALWPAVLASPGLIPHLYGKAQARPGRKMGHVTRLFPKGALPGEFGINAALGVLARTETERRTEPDPDSPQAVLAFWFRDGPDTFREAWFKPAEAFDAECRAGFARLAERARRGELARWAETPEGALALTLLLDQFPRNIHRGTALAFAADAEARRVARVAIARGFDRDLTPMQRIFLYMPLMHSEDPADQDESVRRFESLRGTCDRAEDAIRAALHHRAVITRFGRYPHRNAVLGRDSTPEERAWLAKHPSGFAQEAAPEDGEAGA